LYTSPNVIKVIISRKMIWMEAVARTGVMRNTYRLLVRKPKGRSHLGNLGIDGNIVSKWILEK
jgi:hypothetical protein